MSEYWIRARDRIHGPFSSRELQELIAKGKLKKSHEVSPDRKRWKRAAELNGLSFPASQKSVASPQAAPPPQSTPTRIEEADGGTHQPASSTPRDWRSRWLAIRHFLVVRRIPVAITLLSGLAAVHYFVISPWLHFSQVFSAAEEGNVPAQMEVAFLYETGAGTWQSYPDALKWYATAAENGDINAMFLLYGAVAAERSGDEARIVLSPKGGQNELMGLLTMLGQAYQKGDADRPVSKDDLETFNRVSESAGGIRAYTADPLALASLSKQAANGSAIAAMQLENVSRICEAKSSTSTAGRVDTQLLGFLREPSNVSKFDPNSAGPHAFRALNDVATQFSTIEIQE